MKTLVIAPHPDDETLGVGGTIFKRIHQKKKVGLVIVTSLNEKTNKKDYINSKNQLARALKIYKINDVFELNYLASHLNYKNLNQLIGDFSKIFKKFRPNELFIPHLSDVHTDHQIIFKAIASTTKTFRYPFIKKSLSYETISETGFGVKKNKKDITFRPDYFIDISKYFNKKIKVLKNYKSEIKYHPFPRSLKSIKSLAILRGTLSNYKYAEAFETLKILED